MTTHPTPPAPISATLDAYDALCEVERGATFCMQCEDQTSAKEGALCTGCALQGMDDMDDHERAHGPGRL